MRGWLSVIICLLLFSTLPAHAYQKEAEDPPDQQEEEDRADEQETIEIPDYVHPIDKENTHRHSVNELPHLKPSELTSELLETSNETIDNPGLIRLLNETAIDDSFFTLGFKASIYMGEWALSYKSKESKPNWEYKSVNTNTVDNRGGEAPKTLSFEQKQQQKVRGSLDGNIPQAEDAKHMIRLHTSEKTGLPVSFESVIGQGTKAGPPYNVGTKQFGRLQAFVPAIHEKGSVTYGEVYLVLKGNKQYIEVKNVTDQEISAWLPLKDHIALKYMDG